MTKEQGMVDVLFNVELELLNPYFMELQVHSGKIRVMVGDSLVPAVPQSWRSGDVEILVNASFKVTHVISLDVKVVEEGELGQAEVTVHDVADVRVRSLRFFLIWIMKITVLIKVIKWVLD